MPKTPKIAIVYDRVNNIGGAEKILSSLFKIWPEAPLFTSVHNPETAPWARHINVIPSFLQKIPWIRTHHQWFGFLMPNVFESFNFDDFDIVISVTSAEAKGVITKPETLHICYLLTPTRYLWSHTHFYQTKDTLGKINFLKPFVSLSLSNLRRWDYFAALRPDMIIAISQVVSKRVEKYYRRQTTSVIYPPVHQLSQPVVSVTLPEKFYLVVSRLVSYKRIDLAIRACKKLNRSLVIVGDGPELMSLKKRAGAKTIFMGKVSDGVLADIYQKSSALIFPGEEDFGIVCVEAQLAGKGVIAYNKGGAQEIIQNHTTGVFFDQQRVKFVVGAIERFEKLKIKPTACRKNAHRFLESSFIETFKVHVEDSWRDHSQTKK